MEQSGTIFSIIQLLATSVQRTVAFGFQMESDFEPLFFTCRQRMALRKKQKADKEGEARRKLARQNFSEGQQRFHEHKKKQVHIYR